MRHLFLSFFGAGWLKPAPGTWGSVAAVIAALPVYFLGGPVLLALGAVVLFMLGVRATNIETQASDDHDPSWIVIDEVVGQWIALLPVAIGAFVADKPLIALWPGILAAFLLFRLFDIWKPWLVGRADARGDALGVMLDDVWAGVFAAVVGLALAYLAHGVL